MRDGVVGMVEIEGHDLVTVQPQQSGRISPTRRMAASGGYIHAPWIVMQLRMIQG